MAGVILKQRGPIVFDGSSYSEDILLSKQEDACLVVMLSADSGLGITTATLEGATLRSATDGTTVAGDQTQGTHTSCYLVPLKDISSGKLSLAFTRSSAMNDIVMMWYVVGGVNPAPKYVRNTEYSAATSISVPLEREENALTLQMVSKYGVGSLSVATPFKLDGEASGADFGGHQAGFARYAGYPYSSTTWTAAVTGAWNVVTLVFSSSRATPLVEETQHFEDGLRSLVGPFWGKPRIAAMLRSIVNRVQADEDTYWQLLRAFHPDTATGEALRLLGKVVGQPKLGFTEDEHRALIRGRIRTNRSFGGERDLLEIIAAVALASEPTHIYQLPFMTVYLVPHELLKAAEAEAMLILLPDGRAAGVRMFVMLAYESTGLDYDFDSVGLILSDATDPTGTPGAAWFDTRQV